MNNMALEMVTAMREELQIAYEALAGTLDKAIEQSKDNDMIGAMLVMVIPRFTEALKGTNGEIITAIQNSGQVWDQMRDGLEKNKKNRKE